MQLNLPCAAPVLVLLGMLIAAANMVATAADPPAVTTVQLDPRGWGDDHVGKAFPEYVTGDECLFCHRDVGSTWHQNQHQQIVQSADGSALEAVRATIGVELANQVELLLGRRNATRFLRRSTEYGKFELFSSTYLPEIPGQRRSALIGHEQEPGWDTNTFGRQCAGCHATAVDTMTQAASATGIDCVACHGAVSLAHTHEPTKVLLSSDNQEPRVVISICGQCHLRGGEARSTQRPYPNTFVPGDNLFRDFAVDLAPDTIAKLPPGDRHLFESTRDVVLLGSETTCLTCHSVHGQSTESHQALPDGPRCATCHTSSTDHSGLALDYLESRSPMAHNKTCQY